MSYAAAAEMHKQEHRITKLITAAKNCLHFNIRLLTPFQNVKCYLGRGRCLRAIGVAVGADRVGAGAVLDGAADRQAVVVAGGRDGIGLADVEGSGAG